MEFGLQSLQDVGIPLPPVSLPPISVDLSSSLSLGNFDEYLLSGEALQIVDELATRLPSHCKIDAYLNHIRLSLIAAAQVAMNKVSTLSDRPVFLPRGFSERALEIVRRSPNCTPQIEQLIQAEIASSVQSIESLLTHLLRLRENPLAGIRVSIQWGAMLEREFGLEMANKILNGSPYGLPTIDGVDLWFKGHQRLIEAIFNSQLANKIGNSPDLLKSHYLLNNAIFLMGWVEEAVEVTGDSGVLTDPVCWNGVRSAMSQPLSIPTGGAELSIIDQWIDFLELACQRNPHWAQ